MNSPFCCLPRSKNAPGAARLAVGAARQRHRGRPENAAGQPRCPRLAPALPTALVSINREFAFAEDALHDGDEVGLFPPVSGGQRRNRRPIFRITNDQLDLDALVAAITLPTTGAACIFTGMVRGETRRADDPLGAASDRPARVRSLCAHGRGQDAPGGRRDPRTLAHRGRHRHRPAHRPAGPRHAHGADRLLGRPTATPACSRPLAMALTG